MHNNLVEKQYLGNYRVYSKDMYIFTWHRGTEISESG